MGVQWGANEEGCWASKTVSKRLCVGTIKKRERGAFCKASKVFLLFKFFQMSISKFFASCFIFSKLCFFHFFLFCIDKGGKEGGGEGQGGAARGREGGPFGVKAARVCKVALLALGV